jgi:hypothetical protein
MTRRSIKVLGSSAIVLALAAASAIAISRSGVAAIVGQTRKVDIA